MIDMHARRGLMSLATLLTCVLAACGQTGDVGKGSGYVYADAATALLKAAERRAMPMSLPSRTLTGTATPAIAGKVVLLNVWASWCGPCRRESTALQRVADDLRKSGVVVIGINTRDQDAAARAYVNRFKLTYASVVDRDGSTFLGGFAGIVPKVYTPTSIVLDAKGRVAGWALGEASYSRLRGLLDPLVRERATGKS